MFQTLRRETVMDKAERKERVVLVLVRDDEVMREAVESI